HTYLGPALQHDNDGISSVTVSADFPFGHGLSYGNTQWGPLLIDRREVAPDGAVRASVTVRNTADRPVADVVQLYCHDPVASVTRPARELVGFARLNLDPGASRTVTFALHADRFSFTRSMGERVVEPGTIELFAGRSSTELVAAGAVELVGHTRRARPGERVMATEVPTDSAGHSIILA